jgi:hypothetical protein
LQIGGCAEGRQGAIPGDALLLLLRTQMTVEQRLVLRHEYGCAREAPV